MLALTTRQLRPHSLATVFAVALVLNAWTPRGSVGAADLELDFVHEVVPILRARCGECHLGESRKGGLSFNTRSDLLAGGESGPVVRPGDSGHSLLYEMVTSADDLDRMPPKGERLSAAEVAILRRWIDGGIPWEPGFTFPPSTWEPPLAPRVVELPAPHSGRAHPIDRILDTYLTRHGISIPAPVDDAGFLRRASLDAIGLLPSRDALGRFLTDSHPEKRERKIDELLADNVAYADHWLTFWNDLLRNDYTGTGFITGGRTRITPWLYAALKSNKPYDQFVRELVSPTEESAGFIRGIQWRGDTNSSQSREIQFSQNVSQVFLGINMKCASCHDSFVDRWKLEDAYGLAAIYANAPLELHRCDKPTGRIATPRWIFPSLGNVDPEATQPERLRQLASLITHRENGRWTRTIVNRVWHRLMGRAIVHPVDAMHTQPWSEDLLDYLAVRFAEDGYDLRGLIALIMTSQAYQSRSVAPEREPGGEFRYRGRLATRMTAEQLLDGIWQLTGAFPESMTARVDRRATPPSQSSSGSSAQPDLNITGEWIWKYADTSRSPHGETVTFRRDVELTGDPTSAFVIITCDNKYTLFVNGHQVGSDDEWPTVERYDVSGFLQLGRNVVEVQALNAGSAPNPAGLLAELHVFTESGGITVVTDSSWHWTGDDGTEAAASPVANQNFLGDPVRRLFRDRLNGAPSPAELRGTQPIRAALVENNLLMRTLGRPHRDQVVTTRPEGWTTLEAMYLLNGELLAEYLAVGARKLVRDHPTRDALIEAVFLSALSRPPSEPERTTLLDFLDLSDLGSVEDLLWSVLMLPEFQVVR